MKEPITLLTTHFEDETTLILGRETQLGHHQDLESSLPGFSTGIVAVKKTVHGWNLKLTSNAHTLHKLLCNAMGTHKTKSKLYSFMNL